MSTIPISISPTRQLATEYGYPAFPVAARSAAGTGLVLYRESWSPSYADHLGHVGPKPQMRLRRRPLGAPWWSPPIPVANSGGSGLAVEDMAAGGRIYAALTTFTMVNPYTSANWNPWACWSDDDGLTWSSMSPVPGIVNYTVTGAPAWHNGVVYLPIYGPSGGASGGDDVIRVYASADRGTSWAFCSLISVSGRKATEPVIVVLADGSLGLLFRTSAANSYNAVYSCVSTDGALTWSTPTGVIYFASGQPNAHVLVDGCVIVVHRGQSEQQVLGCTFQGCRVSILAPDLSRFLEAGSTNVVAYQQLDLTNDRRLCLYGTWLSGELGEDDTLIWASHNTGPDSAPNITDAQATATLYERAVTWVEEG